MEIIATQKFIRMGPRKLRLVADMVRKMQPIKAMDLLSFTPKAAAKEVSGAIKVALSNAKQLGLDSEKVVFKQIEINEGAKLKRIRAGARGRVKPYKRKMSHIRIVLTDQLTPVAETKAKSAPTSEKTKIEMAADQVEEKATEAVELKKGGSKKAVKKGE